MLSGRALFLSSLLSGALAQSTNPFQKYTITAPGINASFIPYGARLTNLYVNDRDGNPQDVALGYDEGSQYLNDTETDHTYYGAVVGRYANRIKNGTFTIDGVTSQIPENEHDGHDTLHGGVIGYDQQNWTVASANVSASQLWSSGGWEDDLLVKCGFRLDSMRRAWLRFIDLIQAIGSLRDNHGLTESFLQESTITFSFLDQAQQGFPGTIITYATYTVSAGPQWTSRLVSIPLDEPTPIMLSNHVYWNLDAFSNPSDHTILNNTLYMPFSDRYIEIDNIEVPNGTIGVVNDTILDFTVPKQIGRDIEQDVNGCGLGCTGYDNAFILDRPRYSAPEATDLSVLTLSSNVTGIQLDVKTNQQSLQIYTCDTLKGTIPVKQSQQHSSNGSTVYVPQFGCIVIETQQWIDGINHPEWGQDQYQVYTVDSEPAVVFAQFDFSIVSS